MSTTNDMAPHPFGDDEPASSNARDSSLNTVDLGGWDISPPPSPASTLYAVLSIRQDDGLELVKAHCFTFRKHVAFAKVAEIDARDKQVIPVAIVDVDGADRKEGMVPFDPPLLVILGLELSAIVIEGESEEVDHETTAKSLYLEHVSEDKKAVRELADKMEWRDKYAFHTAFEAFQLKEK